jgi:hypothetical protein
VCGLESSECCPWKPTRAAWSSGSPLDRLLQSQPLSSSLERRSPKRQIESDARPIQLTRVHPVPMDTCPLWKHGRCPSFKGPSLSPPVPNPNRPIRNHCGGEHSSHPH